MFDFNTVNASLGANTPTSFDPGTYIQTDTNFNFACSEKPIFTPLSQEVHDAT